MVKRGRNGRRVSGQQNYLEHKEKNSCKRSDSRKSSRCFEMAVLVFRHPDGCRALVGFLQRYIQSVDVFFRGMAQMCIYSDRRRKFLAGSPECVSGRSPAVKPPSLIILHLWRSTTIMKTLGGENLGGFGA